MGKGLRKKHGGDALDADRAMLYRAPTSADVIRRITREHTMDPRFVLIDRHMQRWAGGQGTGLPNDERALYPKSEMPPLPRHEAIVTDQVLLAAPACWGRLVSLWYRSDCSVEQMCQELSHTRQRLYDERKLALAYLLGALSQRGVRIGSHEAEA